MPGEPPLPDPRYKTTPPPSVIVRGRMDHILDGHHQIVFSRAAPNVLSTDIADIIFAQILNGLPLKIVALDILAHCHQQVDAVYNQS